MHDGWLDMADDRFCLCCQTGYSTHGLMAVLIDASWLVTVVRAKN